MDVHKLLTLSIPELRERFLERNRAVPDGFLEALRADKRRAARELAERIADKRRENRSEGQRLRHLLAFERELWAEGHLHVAGVDEAGVAPLAGPVVAAAAILPQSFRPRGIDDSKKLDLQERESLEKEIKASALAWSVGIGEVHEIDTINIYHASLLAMRRAVEGLGITPTFLLVDARKVPGVPMAQRGIIHGDALSMSIAAASIIAKTHRDRMLSELALKYPGYGLEKHKGYPTPDHLALLKAKGACDIHRRSFAPVREALGLAPVQEELPLGLTDSDERAE